MTAAEFRKIALSLPEAVEASHVGHPDFLVHGRIFATLGYPDDQFGVLMLTPDEQQELLGRFPEMFEAVKGAWGRGEHESLIAGGNPARAGTGYAKGLAKSSSETIDQTVLGLIKVRPVHSQRPYFRVPVPWKVRACRVGV